METTEHANGETVPSKWPGAFGLYKYSKEVVLRNWETLLLLFLISFVVSIFFGRLPGRFVGQIIADAVSIVISVASYITYLASVKNQKLSVGQALSKCQPMLVFNYFLTVLLVAIISIVSLLLLVVPFFFVAPRIFLAGYFAVDKGLDPVEAVKASWEATRGQLGIIYATFGVALLMVLLFITIIGIPVAIYLLFMYSASQVLLYEFFTKHKHAHSVPSTSPDPQT